MRFGADALLLALDAIDPRWRGARLCVALSGGLDSTVLLHATAALAAEVRVNLRAIHVDHGLQAASPAWADACAAACRATGVPLEILSLRLAPPHGASVEAAAREARYAALAPLLEDGEWLLTAHHRDDQLETVLIQLLRGVRRCGAGGDAVTRRVRPRVACAPLARFRPRGARGVCRSASPRMDRRSHESRHAL